MSLVRFLTEYWMSYLLRIIEAVRNIFWGILFRYIFCGCSDVPFQVLQRILTWRSVTCSSWICSPLYEAGRSSKIGSSHFVTCQTSKCHRFFMMLMLVIFSQIHPPSAAQLRRTPRWPARSPHISGRWYQCKGRSQQGRQLGEANYTNSWQVNCSHRGWIWKNGT